jgi:hypothetical protein
VFWGLSRIFPHSKRCWPIFRYLPLNCKFINERSIDPNITYGALMAAWRRGHSLTLSKVPKSRVRIPPVYKVFYGKHCNAVEHNRLNMHCLFVALNRKLKLLAKIYFNIYVGITYVCYVFIGIFRKSQLGMYLLT